MITAFIAILASFIACEDSVTRPPVDPPDRDSAFTIISPFWSHDGSKIMFFGNVFPLEGYDLYEVDSAGGVARLIMRDSLAKSHPVLSPDGTKIAYLAAELGRLLCCAHVWVMNVDGTNARDLTPFFSNWEYVRWSPDSRYLTFNGGIKDSGIINYQIVKANVETGQLEVLTSGNHSNRDATFLPDGKRIAFRSSRIQTEYGGKVWVMNADGSDPRPIDTSRTASTYPRPSPVTNDLYFYWGLGGEGDAGIYSVNLDSVELPVQPSEFQFRNRDNYLNLAQWSPDGTWLLSLRAYSPTTTDLVLFDQTGAFNRRLTTDFDVFLITNAWSKDSHKIVFKATNDNYVSTGVFAYDLTSNSSRKVSISRVDKPRRDDPQ